MRPLAMVALTMSLAVGIAGIASATERVGAGSAAFVSPYFRGRNNRHQVQQGQPRLSHQRVPNTKRPASKSLPRLSGIPSMALWRGRRGGDEGRGNASFGGGNPGDTSSSGVREGGGGGGDDDGHTESEDHRHVELHAASAPAPKSAGEYKQQISRAEAARERIKRARGALEEALGQLGQTKLSELGLAPPPYTDLHLPPPTMRESVASAPATAEAAEREAEKQSDTGQGERDVGGYDDDDDDDDDEWLGRLSQPDTALAGLGASFGEAIEDSIDAVGEGISALDESVERARASVETALNELGLAVPSAPQEHREDVSAPLSKGGVPSILKRRWLPERIRATLDELTLQGMDTSSVRVNETAAFGRSDVNATTPPVGVGAQLGQRILFGSGQQKRGMFLRRSLPSLPSAERVVRRAKDALGTAMDDLNLGLTPPPVGSALERFLHADELLGLWRQEEEVEDRMEDGDDIIPGTDIGLPERRIWVVTTAALPWMTGTSVNPLLRAAYLSRGRDKGKVSLMIPWVGLEDQAFVLPEGKRFAKRSEQEEYIRDWLRAAGMKEEADDLDIAWYEARYHQIAGCIFPMGDITRLIPDSEADVCIMEEPEHLNWFRATGANWSKKFTHVVGVIHTNYIHYTLADKAHWASGRVKAPFARAFNKIMARAYCDKVIKLSATLQKFAEEKETVTNVHGVRENFLLVGDENAKVVANGEPFPAGAYFLGKMLWEKGYGRLWDLLKGFQETEGGGGVGGGRVAMCAYGSGPDRDQIHAKAAEMGLDVTFFPATDHADLGQYKIFVNPSESEVLCTTVAEALAMGKFVVIAEHASNEFFYQFPNALWFSNQEEFNEKLKHAMANEPTPLTPEQRHVLGWEAATDRLVASAKVTVRESRRRRRELDEAAWLFHYYLGSGRRGDRVRRIMAGGVVAGQNAHMESLLAEEEEAQREVALLAAMGGDTNSKGVEAETSGRTIV